MKHKLLLPAALVAAACIAFTPVAPTACYLEARTGVTTNVFTAGEVEIDITESFTGLVKSNVCIKNDGTAPVYVRVKAVPGWYDQEGKMRPLTIDGTYSSSLGAGWVRHSDGYYYAQQPLEAGASTSSLFASVQPRTDLPEEYAGMSFHFDVLAEAVQANGTHDADHQPLVMHAWGVQPENLA